MRHRLRALGLAGECDEQEAVWMQESGAPKTMDSRHVRLAAIWASTSGVRPEEWIPATRVKDFAFCSGILAGECSAINCKLLDNEASERHAKNTRAYEYAKTKSAAAKKALLAKGEAEEEVESGFTCMECRIKFAGELGFERHNLTEHSAQSGLRVPDEMQVMASACVVADAKTRTVLQCESFQVKYFGHGGQSTTVGETRGIERGAHMCVPWQGSQRVEGWVDSQTTVMREERLKEKPSARKMLSLPSPGAAKHLRAEVEKLEAGCASSSINFGGAEHNVDVKVKRSLPQRLNWVMDHESGVLAAKIAESLNSDMIASPTEKNGFAGWGVRNDRW